MAEERINHTRQQRDAMLKHADAATRQADALERIAYALEQHYGIEYPGAKAVEEEKAAEAAPKSFNPYTESAPGVPLPGQEPEASPQPSLPESKPVLPFGEEKDHAKAPA